MSGSWNKDGEPGVNPGSALKLDGKKATLTNRALALTDFATSFDEDVQVKVEELQPGQKFEIAVKLSEPFKESKHGVLTFATNLPDHPTVAVPIEVIVSKP